MSRPQLEYTLSATAQDGSVAEAIVPGRARITGAAGLGEPGRNWNVVRTTLVPAGRDVIWARN
jgi:hypothetical protein